MSPIVPADPRELGGGTEFLQSALLALGFVEICLKTTSRIMQQFDVTTKVLYDADYSFILRTV